MSDKHQGLISHTIRNKSNELNTLDGWHPSSKSHGCIQWEGIAIAIFSYEWAFDDVQSGCTTLAEPTYCHLHLLLPICFHGKFCQKLVGFTWWKKKKEKKDDTDAATGVSYGVASFSSWSKSICNPQMGFTRIRRPPKTIASFWRWTLQQAGTSPPPSISLMASPYVPTWLVGNTRFTPITPLWLSGP